MLDVSCLHVFTFSDLYICCNFQSTWSDLSECVLKYYDAEALQVKVRSIARACPVDGRFIFSD